MDDVRIWNVAQGTSAIMQSQCQDLCPFGRDCADGLLHYFRFDESFGERTVILLTLPLPIVGVSIRMERGCQQNDSLADG